MDDRNRSLDDRNRPRVQDRRDPNLPNVRSRASLIAAVAIAIGLGVLYYVFSLNTQTDATLNSADPPPAVTQPPATPEPAGN